MTEGAYPSRRAFVTDAARKIAYIAPAVAALKAAQRAGADFTGCVGPGSVCLADAECCTGYLCYNPLMEPCETAMNMNMCACE
jgi:hypothetical protein